MSDRYASTNVKVPANKVHTSFRRSLLIAVESLSSACLRVTNKNAGNDDDDFVDEVLRQFKVVEFLLADPTRCVMASMLLA
jgi:hypothetical protein